MSVTGINQLTSFYFDQESPILLSGTVTGSLFICSKMVRYTASVCLSVVPSSLDLFIAQPLLPGQDSLLAQPIFWPRLLACSANLPAKTPCLLSQCFRPRLLACSADASGQDYLLDLGLVEYPDQRPFFPAPPQPLLCWLT